MKKIKLALDLYSIVEFELNEKEKVELIEHLAYSTLSTKQLLKFEINVINGIKEVAIEQNEPKEIISALDKIVKYLKNENK